MTQASPSRIQRKRTKGWTMPPNAVYVGRPTAWGNPFKLGECYRRVLVAGREETAIQLGRKDVAGSERIVTREQAVAWFRWWCGTMSTDDVATMRRRRRGKDLACCPLDQPCHADVLLELANA